MSCEGMGKTDMHDRWCSPTAFRVICCIASIFVSALAAHAQQPHWSPFWDAVAARPGVKVVDGIDHKGAETRRIEFPSGVSFNLTREGDEITYFGSDTSGHGAVQCSWEIYLELDLTSKRAFQAKIRALKLDWTVPWIASTTSSWRTALFPRPNRSSRKLSSSANDWPERGCADCPMTIAAKNVKSTPCVP
jgi:hypothetical protein